MASCLGRTEDKSRQGGGWTLLAESFVSIQRVPGSRLQDYRDYFAPIMLGSIGSTACLGMPGWASSARKASRPEAERKEMCDKTTRELSRGGYGS